MISANVQRKLPRTLCRWVMSALRAGWKAERSHTGGLRMVPPHGALARGGRAKAVRVLVPEPERLDDVRVVAEAIDSLRSNGVPEPGRSY